MQLGKPGEMTAKQFSAARVTLGLTQETLAYALGITGGTAGRYDRGDKQIPQVTQMAIELLLIKKTKK